jgi:thioester reductase-like protein
VCGTRPGVAFEHELPAADAHFRNPYERSKHAAEARVRAAFAAGLSGVVLRPSLVVAGACGTSGAGDVVDLLGAAFASAAAGADRRLALPMPATAAVNAVPVEWVVRMMLSVASRAAHRTTYHLTAPADTTVADAARAAESVHGPLAVAFDAPAHRLLRLRAMRPFRPTSTAASLLTARTSRLEAPPFNETLLALGSPHVLQTRAPPPAAPPHRSH